MMNVGNNHIVLENDYSRIERETKQIYIIWYLVPSYDLRSSARGMKELQCCVCFDDKEYVRQLNAIQSLYTDITVRVYERKDSSNK